MALQIRRGSNADRTASNFIPAQGELVYTLDTKDLWVGDGVTVGGTQIAPVKSVNGLTGTVALTSDNITQGSTNLYYTGTQAKADVAASLISGNAVNTGITFSYNSSTKVISAVVANSAAIASVQADANPALGGNLSLNSYSINGTGSINITGTITGTSIAGTLVSAIATPVGGALTINASSQAPLNVVTLTTGSSTPWVNIDSSRGTLASPSAIQAGDNISGLRFRGFTPFGATPGMQALALMNVALEAGSVTKFNFPATTLTIATGQNSDNNFGVATLNSQGTFNAPIFQVGTYATTAYPSGGPTTVLSAFQITGTAGQCSCATTTLKVGGTVLINGAFTGGSISGYTSGPTLYYIITTNGTTTFTLSTTSNGSGVTTTTGTPAGATFTTTLSVPNKGMIIFDSTTNTLWVTTELVG